MRALIAIVEAVSQSDWVVEYDSGFDEDDEDQGTRYGDTKAWAWGAPVDDPQVGLLKWHVEDGVLHIDSIEVSVPKPLISFRMIDDMRSLVGNLPIDPGMMNADGKRLWDLYRQKRSLNENENLSELDREEIFVSEMHKWCNKSHPDCTLSLEAMAGDDGNPEVYIDTMMVPRQGGASDRRSCAISAHAQIVRG